MVYVKTTLLLFCCVIISGCDIEKWANEGPQTDGKFKNDGKPHYVVSINEYVEYPRAKQVEKKIDSYSGREVWINVNYFVHTKYIEEIIKEPIPGKDNFYNLKLKLNERGRKLWMHMAVSMKYSLMAFVIDGAAYRLFKPEMINENTGWVTVQGPFDKHTAEALEHYSKTNYKFYNPDSWLFKE